MSTHTNKLRGDELEVVRKKMITPYDRGGYLLSDPHFEIGRQLHVNNYYYAKPFFRSVENCKLIANLLYEQLKEQNIQLQAITFASVGDFMGPVLHHLISLIEVPDDYTDQEPVANYLLFDNTKTPPVPLFGTDLLSNVLIILPVTCTFGSAFQIKKLLEEIAVKSFPQTKIKQGIFTVFLVVDENIIFDGRHAMEIVENEKESRERHEHKFETLYTSFGWGRIEDGAVKMADTDGYRGITAHSLLNLPSRIFAAENCPYCFSNLADEVKPLFPTKQNHDTPDLIFNLPKFKNKLGRIGTEDFIDAIWQHKNNPHLFGHLGLGSNSYLHFIERDIFYTNNREKILSFFIDSFKDQFADFEATRENILIITPSHQKTSTILEDLISTEEFRNKKVTIVHTNPFKEFIENFLHDTEVDIGDYQKVFFFDYVISGGKTFKVLSDYLKYARGKAGFDALFCVIDRTTEFSKREILRKLYSEQPDDGVFMSYFKLNFPITDNEGGGNLILERVRRLESIFKECHLDILKARIQNRYVSGKALSLESLRDKNKQYDKQTRLRYKLKLLISHLISDWFYDFSQKSKPSFSEHDLEVLISCVTSNVVASGITFIDTDGISELVIKTLTHTPFKLYKDIFLATFKHVNRKLQQIVASIKTNNYLIDPTEYRLLRFYIKRSADVGSNYIFSKDFFGCIKRVFENPANPDEELFMESIIYFYKELNHKNHERTLKFEELINDPELLPKSIMETEIGLQATFSDRFYQLGRIIKAENIYPLSELKDLFVKEISDLDSYANVDRFIAGHYLGSQADTTNPIVKNAQSLLKRSKENLLSGNSSSMPDGIVKAVVSMLKTVALIKKREKERSEFYENIKGILTQACRIITDEEPEFAFCIELNNNRLEGNGELPEDVALNVHTIRSAEAGPYRRINISRSGLVFKMLNGLWQYRTESGQLQTPQTFLAFTKNEDGDFTSFRSTYYDQNQVPTDVSGCLKHDIYSADTRIVDEKAEMVLLFRLADFALTEDAYRKGEAVLVITSRKKPSVAALTEFINIERLRLLLLIKEDLLEYLRKQFGNDAFMGMLEGIKELEIKGAMEHMVGNYYKAINHILTKSSNSTDQILLRFLNDKIYRHIRSISQISFRDNQMSLSLDAQDVVECDQQKLEELFDLIAKTPYLAYKPLPLSTHVLIRTPVFTSPIVIYEQVIPELMINMRRYALYSKKDRLTISIRFENNKLIFENDYSKEYEEMRSAKRGKRNGGREMCNYILEALHLPPLSPTIDINTEKFTVTLHLK